MKISKTFYKVTVAMRISFFREAVLIDWGRITITKDWLFKGKKLQTVVIVFSGWEMVYCEAFHG